MRPRTHHAVALLTIVLGTAPPNTWAGPGGPEPTDPETCETPPMTAAEGALEAAAAADCANGWHPQGWPQGNVGSYKAGYLTTFANECYFDVNQYLQCYFADPATACAAVVEMNDVIQNNGTQFMNVAMVLPIAGQPESFTCKFGNGQLLQVDRQPKVARGDFVSITPGPTATATEVSGPYRSQPVPSYTYKGVVHTEPKPGFTYTCSTFPTSSGQSRDLRWLAIQINKANHRGVLTSDLAGYVYPKPPSPCIIPHRDPGLCIEPTVLLAAAGSPDSVQFHHIIPRRSKTTPTCPQGKNAMKNGALISAQLNGVLSNNPRPAGEVLQLNALPSYVPLPWPP